MSRREFLRLVSSAALVAPLAAARRASASPAAPPPSRTARGPQPIRAIAFDLFTIFDPRSMIPAVEAVVPGRGAAFAAAWRSRQFDYSFVRAAGDHYADFRQITDDALVVTAREQHVELSAAARRGLVDAYSQLTPWPDAAAALHGMRQAGLRLAPLTNFTDAMTAALLAHAGLADVFELRISTDAAKTFKPSPRAYQLAVDRFGLAREQIAFAAFGGWDAAGASWFGYPTFWVNRLGVEPDQLDAAPATGRDLTELAAWITTHDAPAHESR